MLLELKNAKKQYGTFELDCSLKLEPGQVTGLIGQNGAGKSTTFKLILGLIHADGGNVEVFGKPAGELSAKEKEEIGVVLADSGFSGYLKVKDVISVLDGLYSRFDKKQFEEQCRRFQIPLDKQIKEFSTGMKAKLKVLVAMSHKAKLLILDEPTAGLDVIARDELLDLLRSYIEEEECGILISSHISSDLEGLCDDLYMIHQGKIVLHEETDVLLGDYGILKLTEEQYENMDKQYLLREKKEGYGYRCLTDQKQFYLENYPQIIVEKGNVDETITMMIQGKEVEKK